jgi:hypothetical protein
MPCVEVPGRRHPAGAAFVNKQHARRKPPPAACPLPLRALRTGSALAPAPARRPGTTAAAAQQGPGRPFYFRCLLSAAAHAGLINSQGVAAQGEAAQRERAGLRYPAARGGGPAKRYTQRTNRKRGGLHLH